MLKIEYILKKTAEYLEDGKLEPASEKYYINKKGIPILFAKTLFIRLLGHTYKITIETH